MTLWEQTQIIRAAAREEHGFGARPSWFWTKSIYFCYRNLDKLLKFSELVFLFKTGVMMLLPKVSERIVRGNKKTPTPGFNISQHNII